MRPPSMPLLSAVVAGLLAQPAAGFTPAYSPVALRRPTSSPLCHGEQSARLRRRPQLGMMTTRIPEGDGVSRRRRRRDRTKRSVAEPSTFVGSDPIISASSVEGNYLENVLEEKQAAATRVVVEEPQAATTDEASGWVEDSAELLSKGGRAVGAGAKSVALASTPLRREADGRLAVDGQGLLNLCILVFSGLWAIHSIVTVDAESWRGWTFQEIVMRIPWDNWDSYEYGLSAHPILTKTAINGGIYVIGDWLSQVNWGREEDHPLWEFDLQRTLRNGLIGAFFGPVSHFYYDFSDWILPPVGMNRPFKIMMDQSIYFCTKCTTYITLVSLLRGDSLEQTREALDTRLVKVITTGWRFWPFVHIFTYFLIPPRHRVLWVNCVDLLWSSILAGMTSGKKLDDIDADADGQEGDEASQQLAFEASDIDKTAVDA